MKVLLLGGHGRLALRLTPLLLSRGWDVTSVIRNAAHENEILALGKHQPGTVNVLVSSLDEVTSVDDARRMLATVNPDCVVWSAGSLPPPPPDPPKLLDLGIIIDINVYVMTGAGGKGGPARTHAIDCEAAKHILEASFSAHSVTKFLMISHLGSRRVQPDWMSDDDWAHVQHVSNEVLPVYARAKLEADEYMTALAEKRKKEPAGPPFQAINLRPGLLTDQSALGKVQLGKTRGRGSVTREDVADVAARLLERDDTGGWYDLLNGDEEGVQEAVERVVRDRVDAVDGEDVDGMVKRFFG